ncbi:inter-alpha-trypsin inhibitor heavy chain H4-like [Cloeon dipterum]|uniref:inter-alpha-trypsin inhibitor heavy chain H4-like n=1 Tax=Cloeon dipterum TaxID=197152 RepID=UPI00321FEAA6
MRLCVLVLALVAVTITSKVTAAPTEKQVVTPKIYFLHIKSDIRARYAKTFVTSKVVNPSDKAQEVVYQMTIPETAFISNFTMLLDDELMKGQVKERTEAKHEYHAAKESGQTAGHVATATVRDSNQVRISVNVGPQSKVTFNVTYEELLVRRKGRYELSINVNPRQVVPDLAIDVFIKENRNITLLQVPEFRSSNEIDFDEIDEISNLTQVQRTSKQKLHLHFAPSESDQIRLAGNDKSGLGGRFVVRYDVDRKNQPESEILTRDGYFVHFFTPPEEKPLPKHVVFVLDVSGSMYGKKMVQLKEAMNAILDELRPQDYFNLIEFSHPVTILNLDTPSNSTVIQPAESSPWYDQPPVSPDPALRTVPDNINAYPATQFYINIAKEAVEKMTATGGTNIHDSVKAAIELTQKAVPNNSTETKLPAPIIIFLTDGEATVGETGADKILELISTDRDGGVPIFSLAFGDDADLKFLKRLSLRAGAFARKIYEASDAALQLRDFYRQVASPLLTNATFEYDKEKVEGKVLTKQKFGLVFSGSELVVAGKLISGVERLDGNVLTSRGNYLLPVPGENPTPIARDTEDNFLERLWAFLSIKQKLDQYEAGRLESTAAAKNASEEKPSFEVAKGDALRLALQFSFVTPVTSLVVVKSDDGTANEKEPSKVVIGNEEEEENELTPYVGSSYHNAIALQSVSTAGSADLHRVSWNMAHRIKPAGWGFAAATKESAESDFDSDAVLDATLTSTLETTTPEISTVPISQISWLIPELQGNCSTDDWQCFKIGNSSEVQKVLSFNKSQNVTGDICANNDVCKPFTTCILPEFSTDTSSDAFVQNLKCDVLLDGDKFLGVCCPQNNSSLTTRLEAEAVD